LAARGGSAARGIRSVPRRPPWKRRGCTPGPVAARAQSGDVAAGRLAARGGRGPVRAGRMVGPSTVSRLGDARSPRTSCCGDGSAAPPVLPGADAGRRGAPDLPPVTTWTNLPKGADRSRSGEYGAEFASAYQEMGSQVTWFLARPFRDAAGGRRRGDGGRGSVFRSRGMKCSDGHGISVAKQIQADV